MSEQAASWDMMDCTKQHGNNMANAKQVLDVHVSKGITVAQSNEHMRNWTEKGWKRATDLGNYDPTREHLNFEVVSGGKIVLSTKAGAFLSEWLNCCINEA